MFIALFSVLLINSCVSNSGMETKLELSISHEEAVKKPEISGVTISHEEMKKNLDDGDIDIFIDNISYLSIDDKNNNVEETLIWYIAKFGTRKLPKVRSLEAVKLLIEQGVDPPAGG